MTEETATAEAETLETGKPTEPPAETGTESPTETGSVSTEADTGREEPNPEDEAAKQEAIRKRKAEKKQKHINKLTRESKEAKAEAARLKAELDQLKQKSEPKPDDFESYEDYIQAAIDYGIEQKTPKPETTPEQGPDYASIIEAGKEKFDDFETRVLNPRLTNMTQELAETIAMADNAEDIFYHLASDPLELERISLLDNRSMAREIGRLEATVSIPPPKPSTAPEPVTPLETAPSTEPDEMSLSIEEWARRRNAELLKRGKI